MELLLIGLAALVIALVTLPLVVLRAGIRRLDQADSLTCRPPGISTAFANRIPAAAPKIIAGNSSAPCGPTHE